MATGGKLPYSHLNPRMTKLVDPNTGKISNAQ
jgi:hypothetical protein